MDLPPLTHPSANFLLNMSLPFQMPHISNAMSHQQASMPPAVTKNAASLSLSKQPESKSDEGFGHMPICWKTSGPDKTSEVNYKGASCPFNT